MNAMKEKLETAGVDTIGARLTAVCIEAIRKHPDSTMDAWRYVGALFGHEFIRGLMQDMQRNAPQKEQTLPTPAPYKPRVIPPERLEKRLELQRIVRSKYMNSGGVAWSDVSVHEASGLLRDGKEVEALLAACGSNLPNDGSTFGDVLGIKKVDEIIAGIRSRS